ncbi:MAG: ribonuclease III [Holophagales bacterium]|nr:ribonuclease III [Holophagales bacterium]MYH27045.1 ribonuclease III [Holophagales bacterium]
MTDPVEALEVRLGHRFENRALLEQALTHSSFANERGLEQDNERLEFLGDSVLGLVVADRLFRGDPSAPEGVLSRTRSHVVSAEALARRARELDLGPALRLGHGEDQSGGREKPSLLADALEAVIGAVFVDGGLRAARELVEPWIEAEAAETMDALDAKSDLQESLQSQGLEPPFYRHVGRDGPDHDPVFHVECWIGDRAVAAASGHSKKEAERRAAARALAAMERADR